MSNNNSNNNNSYLSLKNEADFNIIYVSDKNKNRLTSIDTPYNFINTGLFKEFKLNFNLADIIIVDIEEELYFNTIVDYIIQNKFKQKIICTIDKGNKEKVYNLVEKGFKDFLFLPIDKTELNHRINTYYRDDNFVKSIYKMKSMEIEDINKQRYGFYNNKMYFTNHQLKKDVIEYNKTIAMKNDKFANNPTAMDLLNFKGKEFTLIYKTVINSYKCSDEIKSTIVQYFNMFLFQEVESREYYLESFANSILFIGQEDRPEETFVKDIINNIISELKEIYDKEYWVDDYIEKLTLILELELRSIGLCLKYQIQSMFREKQKNIQKNSLHYLMSSSADRLNNYLNNVDVKDNRVKNLIKNFDIWDEEKKRKAIENIKKQENCVEEFKTFLQKQSKMFAAFKDEQNAEYSSEDMEFLFWFVFVNGIKVKTSNTVVILENKINSNNKYKIQENILLDIMFVIIENALDMGVKEIKIILKEDKENLKIIISNDGPNITENESKYIFNKFFTTKADKKYKGIGLSIAKNLAESVEYLLDYDKKDKNFLILIPKNKNKIFCELGK